MRRSRRKPWRRGTTSIWRSSPSAKSAPHFHTYNS
jgi:uncharacterized protein (DUF433 family)